MESFNHGNESGGLISDPLCRIVDDPARIESLHDILGPFCHESRNILNSLKMSLYLAQRDAGERGSKALKDVEAYCVEIEELYDRLQLICRPISLTCVRMSLGLLIDDRRRSWSDRFEVRRRTLEIAAPRRTDVGHYDPNLLGRALDAFVLWRAERGQPDQTARLSWSIKGGAFVLDWFESGSGTESMEVSQLGDPLHNQGSFALPFLARVVVAHGGTIQHLKDSGIHVRLSWPQSVDQGR